MMEILRNMWRRKFRTFLTVFGIAIGIFAFTVMGSLAIKFNRMIDGGKKYMTGQISISPKGSSYDGSGGGTLPVDVLNKIRQVNGVKSVAPLVELVLDEPDPDNPTGGMMSQPATIYGMDFNSDFQNANWKTMDMQSGRFVGKGDSDDKIAVGISVATDKKWKTGDTVTIRGKQFKVVGVLAKTMTGPDNYVFMSINPAREMFIDSNPFLKSLKQQADDAAKVSAAALAKMPEAQRNQIQQAKAFNPEDISTMAGVSWKDGVDPNQLADKIKNQFKADVVVLSPKAMGDAIDKASAIFNAVILGSALIALVVGGFSIINTMIMSISERTKEIGIKKAIGASNRSIAWEYTVEAGIIGLVGGAIGMGVGYLVASAINAKMADKGAEIFLLEPNFLIGVIVFSFVLGILAGIIPAVRASKMKVVDAIREL